ncbi:hypothetical protein [Dactylosporangium sp. CA-139066]|uniref:hypothetical protein n=1 Tax=Dactylosporangium sp. CA-139066 TaxID=3239930 RepID=UPI003D93AEF9
MMSPDELREIATQLRAKTRQTDDELVGRLAADVEEYREILRHNPTQEPPAELYERLPLMGWAIYETTWDCVQRVTASFDRDAADPATRARSEAELTRVDRITECARQLPWPEFAPRALGALRALALAESKRDTVAGYDAAWTLHDEARQKYAEFRDSHGDGAGRERFVLALDEVFLQLALAETGTACRTAERVVARWAEQFEDREHPERSRAEQEQWIQRIFRELLAGLSVGERALDTGERIRRDPGFAAAVDEHRLTRPTALQNPGIMTARAASMLLALRPAMQSLGRRPPAPFDLWDDWERDTLRRFERAYTAIEADVPGPDGAPAKMDPGFQRQMVHVRLNLALLKPGSVLPSRRGADLPFLASDTLDEAALDAMSAWLGRGRERGLGAATMPLFIRSLIACRGLGPDDRGYQEWRLKWFQLDQHSDEPGRLDLVHWALAEAAGIDLTGRTR